jgi:hypothetical protein
VLRVPADRSVLDVLRDLDPATPYSCQKQRLVLDL